MRSTANTIERKKRKRAMPTDTSEKGLETLIVRPMTGTDGLSVVSGEDGW